MARGELTEYRRKRRSGRTPEPGVKTARKGAKKKAPAKRARKPKQPRYVVQWHSARSLHYDLRLELDGVARSWALPKGPPLQPGPKRLAVQTEDHPLEYLEFEGDIPEGEYGAGRMRVWDRGTFELELEKPDEIKLRFEGGKLQGSYVLIRTGARDGKEQWLMLKHRGETPPPRPTRRSGHGFGHGGNVAVEGPQWLPRFKPMLATLAAIGERDFDDPGWSFEVKWDGVRALAYLAAGETMLQSRTGRDITHAYPELERVDRAVLGQQVVLDGEIVSLDEQGISDFGRLQPRINLQDPADARRAAREVPASYEVFDLLHLDGADLTGLPLHERRALLERTLQPTANVLLSGTLEGRGSDLYELAGRRGLEGIMAKRRDSHYLAGKRSGDWLKLKVRPAQEFVVGGFTEGSGSRGRSFGALLLGYYDGDDLVYAGHTGTGFTDQMLRSTIKRLRSLETDKSPFRTRPRPNTPAHWVRPELVCEVEFANWTKDGRLRAPSFKGFRDDKKPRQVRREAPAKQAASAAPRARRPAKRDRQEVEGLELTNLDKPFWPEEAITKGDLIDYYRRIAPALLPHLRDRPMVLNRFPDGWDGKSFFQKDAPEHRPAWVQTVGLEAESTGKTIDYVLCPDERNLLWMANLGCIEMNPWLSSLPRLDQPDVILFDLDPEPPAGFPEVVETARHVKRVLDQLGLEGFPKTSGSSGIHVFVPVEAGLSFEIVRLFCEHVARGLAAAHRDLVTVENAKQKRRGRVLLDYRQNGQGKTVSSVYSVRPRAGAPVSTPLTWREVTARLDPARFTMKRVLDRVRRGGDRFEPVLSRSQPIEGAVELLPDIEY